MPEFTLSPIEVACGVTLDAVRETRARCYVSTNGLAVMPSTASPALAGAAARLALGGPVEFVRFNTLDQPVYRLIDARLNPIM